MRVGSIKKVGKVRHVWKYNHTGVYSGMRFYMTSCGDIYREDYITFGKTLPIICKNCIAKLKGQRDRAIKALAKLGVK